jgi:hypothetical protein
MRCSLAFAVLLAACAPSDSPSALDQRVAARPGALLQVDVDLGEESRTDRVTLDVRSHDADEVWAIADVSGPGSGTVSFRVEHGEPGVRLYARAGGLGSWLFGGPSVQLRVFVPREFSVDLRSASGPIRVEDVTGSVRARTTGGRIDVRGAEGPVRVRTNDGEVGVSEVRGDVEVRAEHGSVDLAWIDGAVDARTGQGDLKVRHVDGPLALRADEGELELRDLRGRIEAKTESGAVYASFVADPAGVIETQAGSVEVRLPPESSVALDARSERGAVEVAESLAGPLGARIDRAPGEGGPARVVGRLNGGTETLRVYTARGTVRVEAR